ncbi:hypothetical protein GPAL_3548 [Glaciecola pallidula DSM 14239 = ACAM 615]|uniref:Uncharacterized protein n=1 Tax=Brumicola pallidula DSM 14239 = ACAM 615 TaxID=1121922 RepID=K6YCD5_9ALTE|nr:hypothetical protein GPAL_3548 [Glaciecola pallidula DSM 14239 = ACAM 615]
MATVLALLILILDMFCLSALVFLNKHGVCNTGYYCQIMLLAFFTLDNIDIEDTFQALPS